MLERLVHIYCSLWTEHSSDSQAHTLDELPNEFLRRVMNRFQELSKMSSKDKRKERCYLKHASDAEQADCQALHMQYDLAFFK